MARHGRNGARGQERRFWRIGRYIRLSREDGGEVSESVLNQDRILAEAIPQRFEAGTYEVVGDYIDDGRSGTTDRERAEFQRMVRDVKEGRINCIIVKNLSRAFRNSADQGRFLEEFIPLYRTRFISLYQPAIDTFLDPEAVHGLEVGITGFMNEQYAYKTSVDVRRTFRSKMESGAFIGAFAPYGYAKDPRDKNALIVDEDAAQTVRAIFLWFVRDGLSKAGIAARLNALGVPNPTAYKRAKGIPYHNPGAAGDGTAWCGATVRRILTDEIYAGTMRQGRQRVVSYKVHKRVALPPEEWITVEHAVPALIGQDLFAQASALNRRDVRTPPGGQKPYLFSGFLRCAECGGALTRKTARGHVYYACRGGECSPAPSIREDRLERAVLAAIRTLSRLPAPATELAERVRAAPGARGDGLPALYEQKRAERRRACGVLDGLYCDWRSGEITEEQYRRLKERLEEQSRVLEEQLSRIARERDEAERAARGNPELAAFLDRGELLCLSRSLLAALVGGIGLHADGTVAIDFRCVDPFRRILDAQQDVRGHGNG